MRKNMRMSTETDRKRIISNLSIKSINSTTINTTTDATLPKLDSLNNIKIKVKRSSHQIRFNRSIIKMSQPNNMLELQSIKQSTKIIISSIVQEFEKLMNMIQHEKSKTNDILSLTFDLMNMLGNDFERLEIYLIVLQNKCKTQSITHGILFTFILAIIHESYGHNKSALQSYKQINELLNKYQLFNAKNIIYYRIGQLYQRLKYYEKLLVIGKKLLKFSWFFDDNDYELKSYYLISKGYTGLQDMEMAAIFMNKYLDGNIQQNDHIKNIGKQQILLYQRKIQDTTYRSVSQDDFNLEMFRHKLERSYIKMKLIGGKLTFKLQSNECDICSYYGKNCERIQTEDEHPYKKNLIIHNDSRNRDLIGYYDSESIQQMYIPTKTLPILKQLFIKFIQYI